MQTETRVIVDFTPEEKKLFKKHFDKYGTRTAFHKTSGVAVSTIRRVETTLQATREVKEKIFSYIGQVNAA